MGLQLGNKFDRSFHSRIKFLDQYLNLSVFFNKRSPFLLYAVESENTSNTIPGLKINMFKNLEMSKFCEIFLELHNYSGNNLDIKDQFKKIKDIFIDDIFFIFNETIILQKIIIENRDVFNSLNIYGFSVSGYQDNFIFVIAERQYIDSRFNKKLVRSTGIQISNGKSLELLENYSNLIFKINKDKENKEKTSSVEYL